jgi:hypothetical protein
MDILSYLSELIQTRKIVGINGLGTLYKKKVPGRYDAAAHSFVPPGYTLHFTSELKEDVLLSEYISKQRNVSAETSNYFITEFSEGIISQLQEKQEAPFGVLGKLIRKDEEIELQAAENTNYGFDFYGLPVIKTPDTAEVPLPVNEHEPELTAEEIIPELQDVEEPTAEHNTVIDPEPAIAEPASEVPPAEHVLPQAPAIEEYKTEEEMVPEPEEEPAVASVSSDVYRVEEESIPEPEEEPTIASVSSDNERMEENPGDEIKDTLPETTGISRNDEQQLRTEIEALNFYRSQSPVNKPSISEQEEVISKLNRQPEPAPVNSVTPEQAKYYSQQAEEDSKGMPLFLKIIMGLLILVIMMAIAYYVKPEWFSAITGNTTQTVKADTLIAPAHVITTTDSVATTDSTLKEDTLNQTPAVKKDTQAVIPVVKPTADTAVVYEIIGASMHDQKEADGFIAQMKKSGITAKVVTNMAGRRLKMSIATLKDEESAKREMERLSKKLKIPGIYIYRNKQK